MNCVIVVGANSPWLPRSVGGGTLRTTVNIGTIDANIAISSKLIPLANQNSQIVLPLPLAI